MNKNQNLIEEIYNSLPKQFLQSSMMSQSKTAQTMTRSIIKYIKQQANTNTQPSPTKQRSGSPASSKLSTETQKFNKQFNDMDMQFGLDQLYKIFEAQSKEDLFSKLAILQKSRGLISLIYDDILHVKNNITEFKQECAEIKQKIEKQQKRFSSFMVSESETISVAVDKMQKLFTVRFRKGQMNLDLQDKRIIHDQEYYKDQIQIINDNNKLLQQQIAALKNYVPEPTGSQPVSRRASMNISQMSNGRTMTLNLDSMDSFTRASSVQIQSMVKSMRPGQRSMAGMVYGPRVQIELNHLELLQKFNQLQAEHQQALYRIIRAEQEQRKMQRSRSTNLDPSVLYSSRSNSNALSRQGRTNEETARGFDGISQIQQGDSLLEDLSHISTTGDPSIVKGLKTQVKQLYKQLVEKQEQLRELKLNEHKIQGYDKVVQLYNNLNQKIDQQQQIIQKLKTENTQYNQQVLGLSEQLSIISTREQRASKHNMARNNQLSTLNKILKAENTQLKAQMVQHSTVEEISSEQDSFVSMEPETKRKMIRESDNELLRSKSNQVSQLKLKNVQQSQLIIQKDRELKQKEKKIEELQKSLREVKKSKFGNPNYLTREEQASQNSHLIQSLHNQIDEQSMKISTLENQVKQQQIQVQESKYAKQIAQQQLQEYKEKYNANTVYHKEKSSTSNSLVNELSSTQSEEPNQSLNIVPTSKVQKPLQPFNNQNIMPVNSGAFALSSNEQNKESEDKQVSSEIHVTSPLSIPEETLNVQAEKVQDQQKNELKKYKIIFTAIQCVVFVGFMVLTYYILRSQFIQTQNNLYQQYSDCKTSLNNCQNKFNVIRSGLNITQEKLQDYLFGYEGLQNSNDDLLIQNSKLRSNQIMYMSIVGVLGAVGALSIKYLIDRVFL